MTTWGWSGAEHDVALEWRVFRCRTGLDSENHDGWGFSGIWLRESAQRFWALGDANLRRSSVRICEWGIGADHLFIFPIAATQGKWMVPGTRQLTAVYWRRRIGRRRVRGEGRAYR